MNLNKLFKDLVKAGIFMNDKNGVTAFAKLLLMLNTKYPGWRQPKWLILQENCLN